MQKPYQYESKFFKKRKASPNINRQFINYAEESFEDLYNLADMWDII